MNHVTVRSLRPIRLSVQNVGPFRTAAPTVLHFLVPATATRREIDRTCDDSKAISGGDESQVDFVPCDVFVIQGANNTGKSFLLESMYGLFDLLSCRPVGPFSRYDQPVRYLPYTPKVEVPLVQLDLFATCSIDGHARPAVLTLWFGTETPIDIRSGSQAMRRAVIGREWIRIGFTAGRAGTASGTNEAGHRLLDAIRCNERTQMSPLLAQRPTTNGLHPLPTALYVSQTTAGRYPQKDAADGPDVSSYAPAERLSLDAATASQLAARLSMLAKSDRPRFDALVTDLNEIVAMGAPPRTVIKRLVTGQVLVDRNKRWSHRLSSLGSGEAALITLHASLAMNETEATLTMLDGVQPWIETSYQTKMVQFLNAILKTCARQTLILATTSLELQSAIVDNAHKNGFVSDGVSLPDV